MSQLELEKDEEFVLKLANITLPKPPDQISNGYHNACMIILTDIKDRADRMISHIKD